MKIPILKNTQHAFEFAETIKYDKKGIRQLISRWLRTKNLWETYMKGKGKSLNRLFWLAFQAQFLHEALQYILNGLKELEAFKRQEQMEDFSRSYK